MGGRNDWEFMAKRATERLSDKVAARLCDQIEAGAIAPGDRIIEVDIAERFGVSRTPVREALIRLAREGVLEAADRGYALPREDASARRERLAARRVLDIAIARAAAAAVRDGAGMSAAEKEIEKMASAHQAGRAKSFATAHYRLRDEIRLIAGNRLLARCAALVDDAFRLGREQLYRVAANREATLAAERLLIAAIGRGNADAAEREVAAFLDTVGGSARRDRT